LTVLSPSLVLSEQRRAPERKKKTAAPAATRERGRPELFGGLSFARSGEANLRGWELAGSLPVRRRLKIGADLAGHSGSFAGADLGQTTLLVGPTVTWPRPALTPFARFHLGVLRASSTIHGPAGEINQGRSAFALLLGAGADYELSRRWAARAQAELLFTRGGGESDTGPRLGLGLVCRWGGQ
jgi:hypothetical protein